MKRSDLKYMVLAGLCVLLALPIFGYVQKQAAVRPAPWGGDSLSAQDQRHRWQRRELQSWLLHNMQASAVMTGDSDPRVFEVALRPQMTQTELVIQAQHVRQVMRTYFHEGLRGAVTTIRLRANRGRNVVSVRTGLSSRHAQPDTTWHILAGPRLIE